MILSSLECIYACSSYRFGFSYNNIILAPVVRAPICSFLFRIFGSAERYSNIHFDYISQKFSQIIHTYKNQNASLVYRIQSHRTLYFHSRDRAKPYVLKCEEKKANIDRQPLEIRVKNRRHRSLLQRVHVCIII